MLICHFVYTNVQIRVFISSKHEILQNKLYWHDYESSLSWTIRLKRKPGTTNESSLSKLKFAPKAL